MNYLLIVKPNVGKSSIYNILTGFNSNIIHKEIGTTRDWHSQNIKGSLIKLYDTPGILINDTNKKKILTSSFTKIIEKNINIFLYVIDYKESFNEIDNFAIQKLHKFNKKIILIINKFDNFKQPPSSEIFRYRIKDKVFLSCVHRHGFNELRNIIGVSKNNKDINNKNKVDFSLAILGKPNVGKSSLLNRIFGSDRVVVANEPGTTRDAIDVEVRNEGQSYLFVDTAGIRKPGRRSRLAERGSAIMSLRALERAEIALVILDAETGVTEQDARVLGLAQERGCAVGVLLNKWDLMKESSEIEKGRLSDELARRLRAFGSHETIRISALTGKGCSRIYSLIDRLAKASRKHVATPELNRWLEDVVKRHEPAMAQRGPRKKPVKFFYATQTGVNPPRISVFCSEPRAIKASYIRFLENRYREAFSESGVPIKIILRSRRND